MLSENHEPVRIGFYICHCGTNISEMVDVAGVAFYAGKLPHVVISRHYSYLCTDRGRQVIQRDIQDQKLNRVVVAACSTLSPENTVSKGGEQKEGLNPFLFHLINVREQNAWVHNNRADATEKAKNLVHAAIGRVEFHKPLEVKRMPIRPEVLVVGGGIAGIHAALTLANAGKQVHLVEREPTIGGHMARFEKTFPALECAAGCTLGPKMAATEEHDNLWLWSYSEVVKVAGCVGDFKVQIKRKPRYVREDVCTGCLGCIEACDYNGPAIPDEFNLGMGRRKPIYVPFPQATPLLPLIDPRTCLEFKAGGCFKGCVAACGERQAIDFKQTDDLREIEVGTIIIATGFQTFDARRAPQYGYGVLPNVYTALEVERLLSASGPSGGKILLRNNAAPKKVAIVHCVGSRDDKTNRYCSSVCCLYSLKLALLIKEQTGAEVFNIYTDMRTPGKGMEEFRQRVGSQGVRFLRGKVADIAPEPSDGKDGNLIVQIDDPDSGQKQTVTVDMLVLAVGLEPRADAQDIRRRFNISCADEGFFRERHHKMAPVNTFADGIFLAGCCQGPKNIPDSIAQAGAAAAEALALIDKGYIELEPNTAYVMEDRCSGCKSCVSLCPYLAISFSDEKRKAAIDETLCKGCGVCAASCPSGSIGQNLFEDEEIFSEIEGVLTYA